MRERNWALALASAAIAVFVMQTAAAQLTTYTITTIDIPDARAIPQGINNAGQIVGYFQDDTFDYHGLLYNGGSFTTIDVPDGYDTLALGINNSGQIVGSFASKMGGGGFLRNTNGSFTTFNVPGGFNYCCTQGESVNDTGQTVGYFVYSNGFDIYALHGFLYSGGSFTTIDGPGADQFYGNTTARGINNAGQIVGYFDDGNYGDPQHGFLLDTDGSFITIDPPGSSFTWAVSINNAGEILGIAGGVGTFLFSGGSFTTVDVPGAAFGINDSGQIVGRFLDSTGYHWFVATPAQSPGLVRFSGKRSSSVSNILMGGSHVFPSLPKAAR